MRLYSVCVALRNSFGHPDLTIHLTTRRGDGLSLGCKSPREGHPLVKDPWPFSMTSLLSRKSEVIYLISLRISDDLTFPYLMRMCLPVDSTGYGQLLATWASGSLASRGRGLQVGVVGCLVLQCSHGGHVGNGAPHYFLPQLRQ